MYFCYGYVGEDEGMIKGRLQRRRSFTQPLWQIYNQLVYTNALLLRYISNPQTLCTQLPLHPIARAWRTS